MTSFLADLALTAIIVPALIISLAVAIYRERSQK